MQYQRLIFFNLIHYQNKFGAQLDAITDLIKANDLRIVQVDLKNSRLS